MGQEMTAAIAATVAMAIAVAILMGRSATTQPQSPYGDERLAVAISGGQPPSEHQAVIA